MSMNANENQSPHLTVTLILSSLMLASSLLASCQAEDSLSTRPRSVPTCQSPCRAGGQLQSKWRMLYGSSFDETKVGKPGHPPLQMCYRCGMC